jgi:hypothetical protein
VCIASRSAPSLGAQTSQSIGGSLGSTSLGGGSAGSAAAPGGGGSLISRPGGRTLLTGDAGGGGPTKSPVDRVTTPRRPGRELAGKGGGLL